MDSLPVIEEVLRTPEERFAAVPDFPYRPRYVEVGGRRIAYVDEGPDGAAPGTSCRKTRARSSRRR